MPRRELTSARGRWPIHARGAAARAPRRDDARAGVEAIDAADDAERDVVRRALIERVAQQRARANHFALVEGGEPFVHQRFGNALLLRLRAARAIDVGARAIVIAIEKQHAGPEIDGRFELARKIVIEPRHEEVLDAPFVFGGWRPPRCAAGLTFAGRP